jgi:GAF domain-containing protein
VVGLTEGVDSASHGPSFAAAASVWDLTGRLCEALVADLDGVGCIVSRVIGDVLVQVAEHARDGRSFQLGRGFLISQFPATEAVLRTGAPCAVSVADEHPDPAEIGVLDDLAVRSVAMFALSNDDVAWGLVEVYRDEPPTFDAAELERAQATVALAGARLGELVEARHT